jgi:colanic acid biosynthesis glycosyl transferase WcaI
VSSQPRRSTLLLISQVYVPDPASVGQHLHDVASEMARRGWRVVVLASARGYNDPSVRYPAREVRDGVEIRRLPLSSLGKRTILHRVVAQLAFLGQATLHGLFVRGLGRVLVSTSPPMCSAIGWLISMVRGAPMVYWAMDLNPDQMVEMGWISPKSPIVRLFDFFNRRVLNRAAAVVTLDRFMAERLERKTNLAGKLTIQPPWPHESALETVAHDENPFRHEHGLDGTFVFMYSGNHSLCTPLKTILEAALRVQDDERLVFMFIGAGTGKAEVDDLIAERKPRNIVSLPYQPMSEIRYSLSAADVHLVVVGPQEVGVRHPCKVYGAMALGRPVLLIAPDPCHASDLVAEGIGWQIQHGDVDGAEALCRRIAGTDPAELAAMGTAARHIVRQRLTQPALCGEFCDIIESAAGRRIAQAPPAPAITTTPSPSAAAAQER